MKIDLVVIDKWFRWFIILTAVGFAIAEIILEESYLLRAGFIISMAGIVGYFTNYLAIKMLFQPKQGKVLGWEGLVPKNKPQIAASLAESVQTQLLAPDIIIAYIYERKLIETATNKLALWVDKVLSSSRSRSKITNGIITFAKERGPQLLNTAFDSSEDYFKSLARNPEGIQEFWQMLRDQILEYIKDKENRQRIATGLSRLLLKELPGLAKKLNDALDRYLAQQNTVGKVGIGIKKLISFDEVAIAELLERFIEDPESGEQFMGMLDELVEEFEERLESEEMQVYVIEKVEHWLGGAADFAREKVLKTAIEKLQDYLNDDSNWENIDDGVVKALEWIKSQVVTFVNSENGKIYIEESVSRAIKRLNVTHLVEEQVMKLDTDDLEKMILDNTGGNLVVIQFLGGVLGLVAGSIQVNILFAIPVFSLVLWVYLSNWRNRRKFI